MRAVHASILSLGLLIGGCEFDLDAGAAWRIDHPRVIGLGMEVVEPTSSWPDRIGFDPAGAPIAEALPGDRVRLVPMVVDGEGREQPPSAIDALWFQCGPEDCSADVPACDSLEWTTDVACEIGQGGELEFSFPALGPLGFQAGSMTVLGIIGREPGADAQRCRAGLLAGTSELSACTLVVADVLIGPPWVLLFEAVDAGLEVDIPLDDVPYPALLQPANRAPAPGPMVFLDADTELPLEGSPPRVHRGQRVRAMGPSWRVADRQLYASAKRNGEGEGYTFRGHFEGFGVHYLASGPMHFTATQGYEREFVVDESARAGIIRLVIVVGDLRRSESRGGAVDMYVEELEVGP